MSADLSPEFRQETLPFYGRGERPQLDRYQRIETLQHVEGFMPANKPEQVEAMGLESVINRVGGAAMHLAEVAKRQHKTGMDDPHRTTRKITRLYGEWAIDAIDSSKALGSLQSAIALDHDINPKLRMNRLDDVVDENRQGLLALLRWYDLSVMRQEGDISKIGYDPQKVDYKPDNGGIMVFLDEALESWRVHQVRLKLPMAIANENNRSEYWAARLGEVSRHYPLLRPVAEDVLAKISERSQVQ